jgi:hypothetical protein
MRAAPASSLASGSLTLSVSSGQVAGLPVTYTVTGMSPGPDAAGLGFYELQVLIRPASLGPCGSNWYLDPSEQNGNNGESVIGGQATQLGASQSFVYSSRIPGNSHGRGLDTLTSPLRPYLVCGWIDDQSGVDGALATAVASFSLRAPRFTVKLSPPSRPRLHGKGTFSVHGTSEIPAHVTVYVLPACFQLRGTPAGIRCAARPLRSCKPTPEVESNYIGENNDVGIQAVSLISREIPRGGFNLNRTVTFGGGWIPATHMVCAWIGITNTEGDSDTDVYLVKSATVNPRR